MSSNFKTDIAKLEMLPLSGQGKGVCLFVLQLESVSVPL